MKSENIAEGVSIGRYFKVQQNWGVAKLVNAPDLGSGFLWVRVPLPQQNKSSHPDKSGHGTIRVFVKLVKSLHDA